MMSNQRTELRARSGREPAPVAGPRLTLVAKEVHKSFGSGSQIAPVLRGISMAAASGETIFLVGPSGSGKTTLLSILGCILTPDRGSLQVLGQEIGRMTPPQLTAFRRDNLGFIFQSFNLFPTLSALDNVCLPLTMRRVPLRTAIERADHLLNQVGLWHRRKARPARAVRRRVPAGGRRPGPGG